MMTRPEPWDMAYEQISDLTRRIEALEAELLSSQTWEQGRSVWLGGNTDVRTCRRCYITEEMPEPKWRRLVEEQRWRIPSDHPPLATVLHCLARIERGQAGDSHVLPTPAYLARVVAVCEAQVGDGWQADPFGWVATPDIHALLNGLTMDPREVAFPETNWRCLGNAAAAWLRDITEATP